MCEQAIGQPRVDPVSDGRFIKRMKWSVPPADFDLYARMLAETSWAAPPGSHTLYGRPLGFWLRIRRILHDWQIETPEDLDLAIARSGRCRQSSTNRIEEVALHMD